MSATTEDRPVTATQRREAAQAERVQARVAAIVAAAPPLTVRQADRIAQLLGPVDAQAFGSIR